MLLIYSDWFILIYNIFTTLLLQSTHKTGHLVHLLQLLLSVFELVTNSNLNLN